MENLYLAPTNLSPEILFSPEKNIFSIKGRSSPEDVRNLYYPVIDWVKDFCKKVLEDSHFQYTSEKPFILQFEFTYFNSSSAKFIFDIITEVKRLEKAGIPTIIEWVYDEEDLDLKEAGTDIAILAEMEFRYIGKKH
jgi:hypothetical protein